MEYLKMISDHDESKVLDGNGKTLLKVFGKNILDELKEVLRKKRREKISNHLVIISINF